MTAKILMPVLVILGFAQGANSYNNPNELCNFACESVPELEQSLQVNTHLGHPQGLSSEFTFITWNIYKARREAFSESFFTLTANADFVAIQEHIENPHMQELYQDSMQPLHSAFGISFIYKGNRPTGVVNLSRWPITAADFFRTDRLEPFVKSPKGIVVTEHRITQLGHLLILNIHGINFRRARGLREQLRMTENRLRHHDGPIIFAGDFNTKTETRLQQTDDYLARFGLRRLTFDNDPRRGTEQLDHIYIRGPQVVEKSLLTSFPGSDHPPLKITFTQ